MSCFQHSCLSITQKLPTLLKFSLFLYMTLLVACKGGDEKEEGGGTKPVYIDVIEFPDPELSICVAAKRLEKIEDLKSLRCSREVNDFTGLDQLTALKHLWITGYDRLDMDFSKLTLLETLAIVGKVSSVTVSSNSLQELTLMTSGDTDINISASAALKKLSMENASISQIDLSNNLALTHIHMDNSTIGHL